MCFIRNMIRNKNIRNSHVARNCPYGRRNPNANAGKQFHREEKFKLKKTMTAITDGGDLLQLNQLLSQQKMQSIFDLIDSSGPPHCPVFTMRLSIRDQADVVISQTFATGRSKKAAKQAAAKQYLQRIIHRNKSNYGGAGDTAHDSAQPKQEPCAEETMLGNAVGALDEFCRVNGLDKPMYEYKMVTSFQAAVFRCDCKVNGEVYFGMGTKKKMAKHSAAHAALQQLQSTAAKKPSAKTKIPIVSIKMENTTPEENSDEERNDGSGEFDESGELDGSNNDTIDDFVQMLDFNQTDVQHNDFEVVENVLSLDASRKLASIVNRYIEIYAEDLKCSPAAYLAAVNHWRHPCEMTELLSLWITSTLQCKVHELLAADVKLMGTSILKANNLLITEANSHVLATYYEFCAWTPICLSDTDTDNTDYFMISSTDACGNNTIRKHYPNVGETIVCHHSTKFRFRGSKQSKRNHFYLVTEWKRSTYNELDSMGRIISTTVPKTDHEKIRKVLLRGLRSIRDTKFDYDLIQCVVEWQRVLNADADLSEVDRIFIDHCVNGERVQQVLTRLLFAIAANTRQNARDCDEGIYQELSEHLLVPIEQFIVPE